MSSPWSAEEHGLAVTLAKDMTYAEVGALLDRSAGAVRTLLYYRLKLRQRKPMPWSRDEEKLAAKLANDLNRAEIAALMGRTTAMVQSKLYDLGIRPGKQSAHPTWKLWTSEELNMLRILGPRHRYEDIAIVMNRTTWSVRSKAKHLGIEKIHERRSQEELVPPELREVIEMLEQLKKAAA